MSALGSTPLSAGSQGGQVTFPALEGNSGQKTGRSGFYGFPDPVGLVTQLCLTLTRVGCHFLLQGIFLMQGFNPRLLHWQVNSLPLSHQGSPPDPVTFHESYTFCSPSLLSCKMGLPKSICEATVEAKRLGRYRPT